jgi:hypothetical protein
MTPFDASALRRPLAPLCTATRTAVDADQAMGWVSDYVRRYVVDHLGDPGAVLIIDDTCSTQWCGRSAQP